MISLITVSHMASSNLSSLGRSLSRFCKIRLFTRNVTDLDNYSKSFKRYVSSGTQQNSEKRFASSSIFFK